MAVKKKDPGAWKPDPVKLAKMDVDEHLALSAHIITELYERFESAKMCGDTEGMCRASTEIRGQKRSCMETDRHVGATRLAELEAIVQRMEEVTAELNGTGPRRMAVPTTTAVVTAVPTKQTH